MAANTILALRRRVFADIRTAEEVLEDLSKEASDTDRHYIQGVIDAYRQIIIMTDKGA